MTRGLGLHGVRKAFASKGDDVTLSRFVKIEADDRDRQRARRQWKLPGVIALTGSIAAGRSVFFRKGVKPVSALANVLVSGHNNVKIGRDVRKGWARGYWIYYVTLEERLTCPSSCLHWQDCYGNNMPFAKRAEHGPELMVALEREIPLLLSKRSSRGRAGRAGLMIRLHQLGDFFSTEYVRFWERMLDQHPRLAIYGYTARKPLQGDGIGDAIARVKARFGRRFAIRWSDGGWGRDSTVSIKDASQVPKTAFVCPEQTGATAACATCGLCWGTDRDVAFIAH